MMVEKISVITPVYNERENLPIFIGSLEKIISGQDKEFEIIIIDDSSPDGSAAIAEELAKQYGNIQVFQRPSKMGLGTAYKEGFKHATGDIVVSIDCDLSHDPLYLPSLIEASRGSDIVIGSRFVEGGAIKGRTLWRNALSVFANWFIRKLTGYQIRDWTSGLRIYRRDVLETVFPQVACKKWDFQFEVLYKSLRSNFSVTEMPIVFKERGGGRSKFDINEAFTFVKSVFQIYFNS
jgi:dolichol-phosphate mannosyltransferase